MTTGTRKRRARTEDAVTPQSREVPLPVVCSRSDAVVQDGFWLPGGVNQVVQSGKEGDTNGEGHDLHAQRQRN
jgi:hypothetical protein